MNLRRVLIAAVFSLASSEASAFSGADLYEFCTEGKGSDQDLSCVSYVHGFIDGMIVGNAARKGEWFCPPSAGISVEQGRLIAEKYLREHPESLHKEAGLLLMLAFVQAFPCQSN
jgi:hypothetical protein